MKSLKVFLTVLFIAFGIMVIVPNISRAEMMKDDKGMMMKGDNMMDEGKMMKAEEAIGGYCPVCLVHGMSMKGSNNFVTEYQGKLYKFSSLEMQKEFVNNPEEYTKDIEAKYQQMQK